MKVRVLSTFAATAALAMVATTASAAPMGTLATTACSGQGVTVSATLIDWLPPGNTTGCIDTVAPTNVAYTGGGPLLPGATGLIKDLTGVLPVTDFMTFAGHPNLHYDLVSVGPGVANTNCPDTFNAADPVCSIFAGSPFVLRPGAAGTTVTLATFGTARDASIQLSNWLGTFSVDFAGETPFDLRARFLATGSVTSGHSGSFVVTPQPVVPEPASMVLLGTGLLGASLLRRRSRKK